MAARDTGEQLAKVAVLLIVVAVLNAFRRGELGPWAKAKLWNDGAPSPAGTVTLSGLAASAVAISTASGATIGAAAGSTAVAASSLVDVGTTKMSQRFAAKWRPMAAAAAKDGVILTGNAWRSNETQIQLRTAHGCGGPRIYDSSCKGTPPTAVPGHSRHETGDAIDVTLPAGGGRQSPEYRWLARNAGKYGIYNLPSEPWHWSIDGK